MVYYGMEPNNESIYVYFKNNRYNRFVPDKSSTFLETNGRTRWRKTVLKEAELAVSLNFTNKAVADSFCFFNWLYGGREMEFLSLDTDFSRVSVTNENGAVSTMIDTSVCQRVLGVIV
eukprot:GHVR01004404.1.p2 GENE.GHVR01004404.1~~GHVR01004404.1.p2  ORF type:complete len:118 (-),score=15.95 GHVR01004404.1:557-910(-)